MGIAEKYGFEEVWYSEFEESVGGTEYTRFRGLYHEPDTGAYLAIIPGHADPATDANPSYPDNPHAAHLPPFFNGDKLIESVHDLAPADRHIIMDAQNLVEDVLADEYWCEAESDRFYTFARGFNFYDYFPPEALH